MAWFRLDDQGAFHAKVLEAGNEAYGAWCRAGQWSSGQGTEGLIPRATALTIGPLRLWKKLIEAKGRSAVGLVEASGNDFQMHDFLDWNPTVEEVDGRRVTRSEAGRQGGLKKAENARRRKQTASNVASNPASKPLATEQRNSTPIPIPIPIPRDLRSTITPEASPSQSERVVDLGTARCEAVCETFVAALSEAGWSRGPVRERWDRQALCDGINANLRADGTAEGILAELRRAVGEWAEAYRADAQFTQGWSARKFAEWLSVGRKRSGRPALAAHADSGPRSRWAAEPPTAPESYAPPTPEEAAVLEQAIKDMLDPTTRARPSGAPPSLAGDLPPEDIARLEAKRDVAVKRLREAEAEGFATPPGPRAAQGGA